MESVNNPSHYTSGEIQAIDAMRAAFGSDELKMFCKISAFYQTWGAQGGLIIPEI